MTHIYHKRADKNLISDCELNEQKQKLSKFIIENLSSPNLAIFIGSGCSVKAVPLMSNTMKSILTSPKKENKDILNNVRKYYNNKTISPFLEFLKEKEQTELSTLLPSIDSITFSKLEEKIKGNDSLNTKLNEFYKSFSDIESLLNWMQSGLNYSSSDTLSNSINFLKTTFIETIPKFSNEKYYNSDVSNNYRKFYQKIFENRDCINSKVSIFTTNYDLFNEYALEVNDISYTTGFKPSLTHSFDINEFKYRIVDDTNRYKNKWQPVKKEANLFKIHGSINWYTDEKGNFFQSNKKKSKDKSEEIVIYPTMLKHKETAQAPYSELFREFSNRLQEKNTTLIVIGYGFPDEHINTIISQNLRNPDFNLIVFGNEEEYNLKRFIKEFGKYNNFHLIGGKDTQKPVHHFDYIVNNILFAKYMEDINNE